MGKMLADFCTKPLTGNAFAWMQKKILNLPSNTSMAVHRSVLNSEDKNIKQTARKQKYDGPKEPGSRYLVDRKVSWAFRTKIGLTGVKGEKSLDFEFI